ncbi:MAG: serine/threonine protein kinase [Pyrinomonadaceae bacterium]
MSRTLQIGDLISDYEIVGFLGAGGMGRVFHGIHSKIGRAAAIKVLSTAADNATFTERFFNEARLQSSLHHPNIATLYDFKEIDGELIIFMEYADGECLEDVIKRKGFTVEQAVAAFESICDAVAFIHSHGIVHRDIKAQNIKVTIGNKVKLLDFGIAKDEASLHLTRADGVIGTPTYLSPEQLTGKGAGPLSDIWSLGVLFYEMLTGTSPFKGDHLGELLAAINEGGFIPPHELNAAIPPRVEQIVLKCLSRDPEARYQSVIDILADIRAYKGGAVTPSVIGAASGSDQFVGKRLASQEVSARASRTWIPLILGGSLVAALIVAIAGFALWPAGGSPSGTNNGNLKPSAQPEKPALVPRQSPTAANTAGVAADSGPGRGARSPDRVVGNVRVTVETSDGSAEVFRNGTYLGRTPYQLEGVEGEAIDLVLKREGFEDEAVRFDIMERKRVYTYSMRRKR